MSLSILNVGHGDTKLTFDKDKPEERERAALIVGEMLRKGFAILVESRSAAANSTTASPRSTRTPASTSSPAILAPTLRR
jgi:hypothetical protein